MKNSRYDALKRRHRRVRKKIVGTTARPRLCVRKALRHLYAQVIDDSVGRTLISVTTNTKAMKADGRVSFRNRESAKRLGEDLGKLVKEKGIAEVVFDRGGRQYHGVIRELADAVRAAGIKF